MFTIKIAAADVLYTHCNMLHFPHEFIHSKSFSFQIYLFAFANLISEFLKTEEY